MKPLSFLILLGTLLLPCSYAEPSRIDSPLKVGVYLEEPFASSSKDMFHGFSVDLWEKIAADIGVRFEFVAYQTIPELLKAVSEKKADIGVGGMFITGERLKEVDFTQPILAGGLQVMVNEKRSGSFLKFWNALCDSGHIKVFSFGIIVILLCTVLLTLAERRWNTEFHSDWANGLSESFYHVMSIAMTGKSSHKGLPGPFGKILAAIWIACGVAVVAYITSSVTSIMTVNRLQGIIHGPQDLQGHKVGAVIGTVANRYCADEHLNTVVFKNLHDAVVALVRKEIDAIVHDAMTLQWYDNDHPELPIAEVGPMFEKRNYGLALSIGNPLRHKINQSILVQNESGFLETLRKHYFGDL